MPASLLREAGIFVFLSSLYCPSSPNHSLAFLRARLFMFCYANPVIRHPVWVPGGIQTRAVEMQEVPLIYQGSGTTLRLCDWLLYLAGRHTGTAQVWMAAQYKDHKKQSNKKIGPRLTNQQNQVFC